MKTEKYEKRDKARHKAKHGMRVANKGIFVIVATIVKKGKTS
jgi:hypothetical protein